MSVHCGPTSPLTFRQRSCVCIHCGPTSPLSFRQRSCIPGPVSPTSPLSFSERSCMSVYCGPTSSLSFRERSCVPGPVSPTPPLSFRWKSRVHAQCTQYTGLPVSLLTMSSPPASLHVDMKYPPPHTSNSRPENRETGVFLTSQEYPLLAASSSSVIWPS